MKTITIKPSLGSGIGISRGTIGSRIHLRKRDRGNRFTEWTNLKLYGNTQAIDGQTFSLLSDEEE